MVYSVEDQWAALLARGGEVDFFGSCLTLPVERRFADLASITRYVDLVLALESVQMAFPKAGRVRVRERKGQSKAHYEPSSDPASAPVIAIPLQQRWAGRESVILHELAHHCACSISQTHRGDPERWHGVAFRAAFCALVQCVLGDEAALLLRTGFEEAGLGTVITS